MPRHSRVYIGLVCNHALDDITEKLFIGFDLARLAQVAKMMVTELTDNRLITLTRHIHLVKRLHSRQTRGAAANRERALD